MARLRVRSSGRSPQAWLTMTSPSAPPQSQATRGGGAYRGWVTGGLGHSRPIFSDWMILTVSMGMATGWRLRQDMRSAGGGPWGGPWGVGLLGVRWGTGQEGSQCCPPQPLEGTCGRMTLSMLRSAQTPSAETPRARSLRTDRRTDRQPQDRQIQQDQNPRILSLLPQKHPLSVLRTQLCQSAVWVSLNHSLQRNIQQEKLISQSQF